MAVVRVTSCLSLLGPEGGRIFNVKIRKVPGKIGGAGHAHCNGLSKSSGKNVCGWIKQM